jgi:glycosyltransferase involved in cell wall biosynthesis
MRVAIVAAPYISIPPNRYGGTEQVITYLIKGLVEMGHEPILLGPGDSKVDCELIPICDKALLFAKTVEEKEDHDKLVQQAIEKTYEELAKLKGRVDIIHSHGIDLLPLQDFPNLTTLHGKIDFYELNYFHERKNLFYASISKNQQGACPDLQYVGVVYNGLEPELFPFIQEAEDYLCFLGRFDREKNPHLAIQLAINLNMKLKIAGKIDYVGIDYFKNEIEPYLNHPNIEYLGELGFDDKVELVSKAKCNLHPTGFREPFGLSVLESAYCGTPTLAIDRGSMQELIENGRTGILVEDFVEGFYKIQDTFNFDREYISNRSRLLFNYRTMTKQYCIAYEKVIEAYKAIEDKANSILEIMKDAKERLQSVFGDSTQNTFNPAISTNPSTSKDSSGNPV